MTAAAPTSSAAASFADVDALIGEERVADARAALTAASCARPSSTPPTVTTTRRSCGRAGSTRPGSATTRSAPPSCR